ncbi:hypothetical protein AL467_06335 [Bartonella bacilliformis]|uniref:Uncharacterized protein n=1 Tax=Bartonella bacilliformis (strain ATCC 35685 / KC583 / Herrer 020/F12,63) TaxID=360095 RepID=A1URD9_BARBK|nr:hypothetical protein BARBAKC583_0206 [Bartonella bacilliformis KC583]AUV47274.1 hypothetical protein AL467_06335 [Bartonella bacilliformis]
MLIPPFLALLFLPLFDSPSALLLKPLSFPAPCQLPLSLSSTRPLFISISFLAPLSCSPLYFCLPLLLPLFLIL